MPRNDDPRDDVVAVWDAEWGCGDATGDDDAEGYGDHNRKGYRIPLLRGRGSHLGYPNNRPFDPSGIHLDDGTPFLCAGVGEYRYAYERSNMHLLFC